MLAGQLAHSVKSVILDPALDTDRYALREGSPLLENGRRHTVISHHPCLLLWCYLPHPCFLGVPPPLDGVPAPRSAR